MSKVYSNSFSDESEKSYEEMRYTSWIKNTSIDEKNMPELSDFDEVVNNDLILIKSMDNLSLLSVSEQPVEEKVQDTWKQKHKLKIEKFQEVRTESQAHGFKFENCVKVEVFKINDKIKYTSKYDIPEEFNTINDNNISIKTTKTRYVGCADIFRFLESDKTEMIIIYYKQIENYKQVIKTYSLHLTDNFMKSLNGDINKYELNQLNQYIKNIPHGKVSKETKKEYKNKCKQLSLEYFIVNPKVDSKKQRRVQCTLKLDAILNRKDIKYEIFNGAEYYGKKYIGKFFSPRRKRNKK
jgi:hypothetical protein